MVGYPGGIQVGPGVPPAEGGPTPGGVQNKAGNATGFKTVVVVVVAGAVSLSSTRSLFPFLLACLCSSLLFFAFQIWSSDLRFSISGF